MVEKSEKNVFEELTSKLKLKRMNTLSARKETEYSKQREHHHEQRFRALEQYTTRRDLVTVQNYIYLKTRRDGKESAQNENNI